MPSDLALDRHRDLARFALGQAEVDELGRVASGEWRVVRMLSVSTTRCSTAHLLQHDVLRLEVAVDDAGLVGVVQGVGHLGQQSRPLRAASKGPAVSRSASVMPWTKSLTM